MLEFKCLLVHVLIHVLVILLAQQPVVAPGRPESVESLAERLFFDEIQVKHELKRRIDTHFIRYINRANRLILDNPENREFIRSANILRRMSYLYAELETLKFTAVRKAMDVCKKILFEKFGTDLAPNLTLNREVFELIRERAETNAIIDVYRITFDLWISMQTVRCKNQGLILEPQSETVRNYMNSLKQADLYIGYTNMIADIENYSLRHSIMDPIPLVATLDSVIDEAIGGVKCPMHIGINGLKHLFCENSLPELVQQYVGPELLAAIRNCATDISETSRGNLRPNLATDSDYDTTTYEHDDNYYFT